DTCGLLSPRRYAPGGTVGAGEMPRTAIEATPARGAPSRPETRRPATLLRARRQSAGRLIQRAQICGGIRMKRIRPAALLSLVLVWNAALPLAAQSASEAARIEQLERDRQDAFVRGDIEALERATAEDYTTINGSGKLSTKPQMMANLRQGKTRVLSV